METNVAAVARMEKALRDAGRLEAFDEPLLTACRILAGYADLTPDDKVWREYRLALRALREATAYVPDDDAFEQLLEGLRTEVGDTKDRGSSNVGRRSGGGRGKARAAADAVATSDRGRRPGA